MLCKQDVPLSPSLGRRNVLQLHRVHIQHHIILFLMYDNIFQPVVVIFLWVVRAAMRPSGLCP